MTPSDNTDPKLEALKSKVIKILGLERSPAGQLVLSNWEDVQTDWQFCVEELMAAIQADRESAVREARLEGRLSEIETFKDDVSFHRYNQLAYVTNRIANIKNQLAQLTKGSNE